MEAIITRHAFVSIKPLCDLLMRSPNVQNAINVEKCIKNLSNQSVQNLIEYILYPTIVHLRTNISENIKLQLINIIKVAVTKITIKEIRVLNNLYLCLIFAIHDKQQPSLLIPMNEELKESVAQCLKYLIIHSSTDVIELFYTRENAAKLSQSIYACISIAKNEKSLSLRIAAIEALIVLSYVHDEADSTDTVLRNQIANIIMLFLPGIVKGLQDISQGSDVQNHKITLIATRALGRILALVMEDLTQDDEIPWLITQKKPKTNDIITDPLGILLRDEDRNGMEKHIKTVDRNQAWLDAASEKLQAPIRNLINLTKHQHYKVRKELNDAVSLILSKCSRNMNNNFAELVEVIIALSEDDVEDVRKPAEKSLKQISCNVSRNYKMRSILELLEERFYKLLTKLPRIIRMSDNATQLSYLNQLIGYLRLLGKERLPQIMASVAHLRRLLLSLVYVAEFDCSDVTIIEENQLRSIEYSSCTAVPSWKKFKFIRDNATEQKMISICKLLGTLGDLPILIDCIFELITDMPQYQKELILLMNWITISSNDAPLSLYQQVIDYYIAPDFWYLPIQVQDDVCLRQVQSNVILSCLLTEGLGLIAETLQNNYQKFLLKTLYLIIEKAGSGHGLSSLVGFNTLEKIAQSQGHTNIADLIRANVDYFSYHVTIKLRRIEKYPGVLNVVSVVMKYSTLDLLPCLKEIVEDALIQLGANFQQANAYSLLKVLYTFILCIKQMACNENNNQDNNETQQEKIDVKEKVIQTLLEYYEAKKVSEQIDNDDLGGTPEDIFKELKEKEANDGPENYNLPEENETKEPPAHVTMIESVMKRCLHFLPSKDISKTLLAMQTLQEGLPILSSWSEQLLPIVHQLWHPLVDRFHDSNILIMNRAWQLLYTLASLSEDFIRNRTLKNVSPELAKFLDSSSKESWKKNSQDAYKFTQMFKFQKLLLTQLGSVAKNLKLHERDLWKLVTMTEPYLNSCQHPELQECCVLLYKNIADFNGDIVWVKCLSIWNSHVELIPNDKTIDMKIFKTNNDTNNEYRKNVYEILLYIDQLNRCN
ncbi:hypothetical protein PV325_010901 [Microctonus aethiopoides]|nr:hypothetical protein PV325_010901 [Microctonus aethiopoides]